MTNSILRGMLCSWLAILAWVVPAVCLKTALTPQDMSIIANPTDATEKRVLVRYEVPQLLGSARIIHAELSCRINARLREGQPTLGIRAAPVAADWLPGAVSWSSPWTSPGGDTDSSLAGLFLVRGGLQPVRIDVTDLVEEWAHGARSNFGLMISAADPERGHFSLADLGDGGGVMLNEPVIKVWYLPPVR